MLNMNQQETIRLLYESEGKSLREISEITKHDFRTVQKFLNHFIHLWQFHAEFLDIPLFHAVIENGPNAGEIRPLRCGFQVGLG